MELFEAAQAICNGIQEALDTKKGFLVGRTGTIELDTLLGGMNHSVLEKNAGVFPPTHESVARWRLETFDAMKACDLLVAGWYEPLAYSEKCLLKSLGKEGPFLPLRALEPYYVPEALMWTRLLAGNRVAVVNAFATTAVAQIHSREKIWKDRAESLLPDATWIPIRTGYAPVLARGRAEWIPPVTRWQDAVASVVDQVVAANAEIVLIGCGGLGMLVGARLKALVKICIVMGGATQVLVGLKGNRWAGHSVISRFWNDSWTYPSTEETPRGAAVIEGGCYWGTT